MCSRGEPYPGPPARRPSSRLRRSAGRIKTHRPRAPSPRPLRGRATGGGQRCAVPPVLAPAALVGLIGHAASSPQDVGWAYSPRSRAVETESRRRTGRARGEARSATLARSWTPCGSSPRWRGPTGEYSPWWALVKNGPEMGRRSAKWKKPCGRYKQKVKKPYKAKYGRNNRNKKTGMEGSKEKGEGGGTNEKGGGL